MKKSQIKFYNDEAEQYLEQNQEFRTNLIKLINNLDLLVQMEFATWINDDQVQSFRLNGYFYNPDFKIITVFSNNKNQLLKLQMWLKLCQFKSNELDCYYEAEHKQLTFISDFNHALIWNFNKAIEHYEDQEIKQLEDHLVKIAKNYRGELGSQKHDFVFSLDNQNQIQTTVINKSQSASDWKTTDFSFINLNK